ncbi:ATP-binding protein [Rossellomorea aquimaris]|uniref:AAA family ATPase n=1 Tax=Rossellomorea aquimaris TaxID=189382 RepID=UPI001CD2386E|nr:AAA family ATPase [Rossellomorea aquimaris]MCA1055907.1 ATP-binding protein [Rossellomorea aquimaris]
MKRFIIMTVGKTHSGKTTFANRLEERLENAVVVDQDRHAAFINTYYRKLLAKEGPNTFKTALTKTIVQHAVEETDCHLIVCNSNRSRSGRLRLLDYYHQKGFKSIVVDFNIPHHILEERIAGSRRSTAIFRNPTTFQALLERQGAESSDDDVKRPVEGEADYLFVIHDQGDVEGVIENIIGISQSEILK